MSFFQNTGSALRRSTSHIFRRFGGVTEVREVCDKAAQVAVQAFPMPLVASIVASEAAHVPLACRISIRSMSPPMRPCWRTPSACCSMSALRQGRSRRTGAAHARGR